jgi:HD-like signal output (HDOD) protein/CheY-like chemotaxis protein
MSGASRTTVLFVDDEPMVLRGLQRMLRPLANEWEMAFVESGEKALEAMAKTAYSVVVTDMRMPGMNGAQLLGEISKSHPKSVRIILSGHADKNLIVQCVGTAHQFLSKPCEPEALKAAVERASQFERSLKSEILKELITKMETLPSMPELFHRITKELRDEKCSLDDVGDIIATDIGMTAKLLKLVNSAFFGLRRQVNNPHEAVTFLGLDTIKALVLAVNAFDSFEDKEPGPLSIDRLWAHSMSIGNWCKNIARHENCSDAEVDECFISGMLHDVGKLALSSNLSKEYQECLKIAETENISIHAAEEKVFGANHADVGGYLLSLWGLPGRVVDAIASHHNPSSSLVPGFGPLAAVHAADVFASEAEEGAAITLDEEYIQARALREKLEAWKDLKP